MLIILTGCSLGLQTLPTTDTDTIDPPPDTGVIDDEETAEPADTGSDCTDSDGDGWDSCTDGDCDDSDEDTFPGAAWNDSSSACMTDADGDGYGDDSPAAGVSAGTDCDDSDDDLYPEDFDNDGFTLCDGDCLDTDPDTFPGAAADESASACMTDADGDGWGDDSPAVGVTAGTDCDDSDPRYNPGAEEEPFDGDDQNCDGDDGGTIVTASGTGGLPISDNSSFTSAAVVVGCTEIIDITIDVNITHTYIGDLTVAITSPSGTSVTLHNKTGASSNNIIGSYSTSGGTLTPSSPLSPLIGEVGSGSWSLTVADDTVQDTGTLNAWGLELRCP